MTNENTTGASSAKELTDSQPSSLNSQVVFAPARLREEPAEAYTAFVHYYRAGRTAKQVELARAIGITPQKLSTLKKRWEWEKRVAEHMVPLMAIPDHSGDWAGKHEEVRSAEWQVHVETLQAGREALVRWRESNKIPGLSEIARVLEISLRLARLAAGLPLKSTEITTEQTSHIHIDFEAALKRVYGDPPPKEAEAIDIPVSEAETGNDV